MNCEEAINLMDGYVDGELDPVTNQEIERHLRDCRGCEQAYEAQRALVRAIGSTAPYYKAPAELRQRIQSSLRNEIGAKATQNGRQGSQLLVARKHQEPRAVLFGIPWNSLSLAGLSLAAAIIFAAIMFSNLAPRLRAPNADEFLATQLIASHVRSLMASHLTDVASSDQHTVKPWLDAKLDFAPPVVDLTNKGFPLIGGRLDYLDNRPVAALIYHRRQHFINLFIWPAAPNADKMPKTLTRDGYQLLHWDSSPFNYWAVSDVSEADLQAFKQAFEEQTARH
jgi:mycothiol system anti-sigma-R factor